SDRVYVGACRASSASDKIETAAAIDCGRDQYWCGCVVQSDSVVAEASRNHGGLGGRRGQRHALEAVLIKHCRGDKSGGADRVVARSAVERHRICTTDWIERKGVGDRQTG